MDTRSRIVAAAVELMREANINPTADEIAARANIGRRSVFRHFKNMEGLHQLIILELGKPLALVPPPFQSSDWQGQIYEIMDRRLAIFEAFLPFKRAADAHRHASPVLQADYNAHVSSMRSRLTSVLPSDIRGRQPLFEAIDLALSFEAWQRLRVEQQLCVAEAREAIATLLSHLLPAQPDADGVSPDNQRG